MSPLGQSKETQRIPQYFVKALSCFSTVVCTKVFPNILALLVGFAQRQDFKCTWGKQLLLNVL